MKIGISQRPEKRLKQLQTAQPQRLELKHTAEVVVRHAKLLEQFAHAQIGHRRLVGEWFDLSVANAILEVQYCIIRWESDPSLDIILHSRRR